MQDVLLRPMGFDLFLSPHRQSWFSWHMHFLPYLSFSFQVKVSLLGLGDFENKEEIIAFFLTWIRIFSSRWKLSIILHEWD